MIFDRQVQIRELATADRAKLVIKCLSNAD